MQPPPVAMLSVNDNDSDSPRETGGGRAFAFPRGGAGGADRLQTPAGTEGKSLIPPTEDGEGGEAGGVGGVGVGGGGGVGRGPGRRQLERSLRVVDGLGVTVGIMVGSGVFASPGEVVERAGGTRMALLAWSCSTILVLLGALCYAELGAAFPHAGGDYWFLRLAYGEWAGFAFSWTNFFVLKTGSQAIILYVGSSYLLGGVKVSEKGHESENIADGGWQASLVAIVSVWVLTAINCYGLRFGTSVQNVLTSLKGLLLLGIALSGIIHSSTSDHSPIGQNLGPSSSSTSNKSSGDEVGEGFVGFLLAMVACLWAFDGWADVAFLGEELRNPGRSLPIVVCSSVLIVSSLFLFVNISYMMVLTSGEMEESHAVALDFAKKVGGGALGSVIAFGIAVSSLGSANGSILTGGRVFFAAARDKRFPSILARISSRGAPYAALIAQGVVSTILLALPGASFSSLLHYFAPASWLFYAATGSSVIALRRRFPDVPRAFKCPLYPFPPIAVVTIGICLVISCLLSTPLYSTVALIFVLLSYPVHKLVYSGGEDGVRNTPVHDDSMVGVSHHSIPTSSSNNDIGTAA